MEFYFLTPANERSFLCSDLFVSFGKIYSSFGSVLNLLSCKKSFDNVIEIGLDKVFGRKETADKSKFKFRPKSFFFINRYYFFMA